jgi:hypothetical protein
MARCRIIIVMSALREKAAYADASPFPGNNSGRTKFKTITFLSSKRKP